jgi:aspartyl-tRNA(Asn)/glutamyl-tRNA(Gln) amidotransferase subunit C
MSVDRDLVKRLADLSRLELADAEVDRITTDLDRIVAYVACLGELDLDGVEPLCSVAPDASAGAMRADEPRPSLSAEVALAAAPRAVEGGFAVPRFVDEG